MAGDRNTALQAMAEGRALERADWAPRWRERFRAWITGAQGRFGDAAGNAQSVREALALAEQGGLENSTAMMQAELFDLALFDGDASAAVVIGQKALNSLHRLGLTTAWSLTAAYLCSALALTGQLREAAHSARQALPLLNSIDLGALSWVHVAVLGVRCGLVADAARLLGRLQAWYAANHHAPDNTIVRLYGIVTAELENALGNAEFARLREDGAAMIGDAPQQLALSVLDAAASR